MIVKKSNIPAVMRMHSKMNANRLRLILWVSSQLRGNLRLSGAAIGDSYGFSSMRQFYQRMKKPRH